MANFKDSAAIIYSKMRNIKNNNNYTEKQFKDFTTQGASSKFSNKSNITSTDNEAYGEVVNQIRNNKDLYKGAFKDTLSQAKDNLVDGYGKGSVGGVAMHLAKNGAQGAIAGGAVGGTVNYAQGGSFWDGAKSGAVKGGVGYGTYRAGLGAAGVKGNSLNVFKGTKEAARNFSNMYNKGAMEKVGVGVKEHFGLMNDVKISKEVMKQARKDAKR